jgi:hypothetical protein
VIPPARTGRLRTNKKAVIHKLIIKRGTLNHENPLLFKLFIVHKKLIDPAIELIPAK